MLDKGESNPMLPFSTWRDVFRIPWIRDNRKAVRFLSDLFYLLLALYRAGRIQDFNCLKMVYYEMIESFAQYGRSEAKDTVDRVLQIQWFKEHRRDLYHLIASYKRVQIGLQSEADLASAQPDTQRRVNEAFEEFVRAFKALIDFGDKDEARVRDLLERPEVMDESMAYIKKVTQNCDQRPT